MHDYHLIPLASAARTGHQQSDRLLPARAVSAAGNAHRAADHERLIPTLGTTTWWASRPRTMPATSRAISKHECWLPKPRQRVRFTTGERTRARRRLSGRHRDRAVQRAGAPRGAVDVRAARGREPAGRAGHRRRPAGLFQGPAQRLEAYERFLALYPEWRGKVTYLQITPKSRAKFPNTSRWSAELSRLPAASTARTARWTGRRSATSTGRQPHRARRPLPRGARRRW